MTYDETVRDQYFHGTHVAGIIAQTAPGAQILPLKVFENGKAYTSDMIDAIQYAENHGASVVNCSFGSTDNNQALRETMEGSDMLFVCAAGNNRTNVDETPIYPACFDLENSLSVTSLNEDKGFSYYSNYGTGSVDIAARGRDVVSAYPGGETGTMSGTSMAAGYVSAAAAIAGDNARAKILDSADRLSNLNQKVAGSRALNLDNLIGGIPGSQIELSPADDFDVHGYQRTPAEDWELFCSLDTVQVAAGRDFSLALKADGSVWAWGNNSSGQLGDGTTNQRGTPKQVVGLTDVVAVKTGDSHTVALKSDGTVFTWGRNDSGQLGDGTNTNRAVPTVASSLTRVTAIAAGDYHTVAIKDDETVVAWGRNIYGELGDGTTIKRITPVTVVGVSGITAIAAGNGHTAALKNNGIIYAWGCNGNGQLGDGTTTNRTTPVAVSNLIDITAIALGSDHSVALKNDGTVFTWGYNSDGQLGDGTTTRRILPTVISGLTGITAIAAGRSHTITLKSNGSVVAWGYNAHGELGNGTSITQKTPTAVMNLTNVIAVAAGGYHTLA